MRVSGKQTKRIISVLLCLALLVSMLAFALTVRAEETEELTETAAAFTDDSSNADDDALSESNDLAGTGAAGDYIYCKNTAGWSTVTAYMWVKNTQTNNASWPGVAMTKVSGNIWSYKVPSNGLNMIIFSNNGQSQTSDMDYPGAGYIYDNSTKEWTLYAPPPTTQSPTQGGSNPTTAPTQAATQSGSDSGKTYVYCENEAGWGSVTAYMWLESPKSENATWPGKAMTKVGGNIWRYEVTNTSWNMIIFSNNGQSQTSNLTFPGKNAMWNNATNTWSVYDTSPLQISSFSTDLESPQYDGVGITLSAEAEGQGTVYYKFSVTNSSGGTTVLHDYSTQNSAMWIPQVVGTYTLTYEFRDTAGNTNKRTKEYTIESGLSSVAPYLKTVTPAGGDIQNGKAVSLSVTAGGGMTGTNLLFYKFTVKDPSGSIVNTPYYTLNKNYSFTPSSLGAYTVTVNIQGSDNKTIEREFSYKSVGTVIPTEPETQPPTDVVIPTQPPTQAPTQAPTDPAPAVFYGDADDDEEITILDVTYIQRYDAGVSLPSPLNRRNADVDGDDEVTILDGTYIQRFIAGIIKKFPAEHA